LIKKSKDEIKNIREKRDDISQYACKEFSIKRSAQEFTKAIDTIQKQL